MNRSTKTLLALAAGACLATAAHAQQGPSGVVLGVAGGISKFNESCEGVSNCDTTDRATRLNAGYGMGNGLVIEAVSYNFGKLKGVVDGIALSIEATAIGGGVAWYSGMSPSSSLFVRLGVAKAKAKTTASLLGFSASDTESKTGIYAGVGFAWNVTPSTAVELAWETTQFKLGGENLSASAGTVGVSFRF